MKKIKAMVLGLLVAAFTSSAVSNNPKVYTFIRSAYPGLVVHVGSLQAEEVGVYNCPPGTPITATWPGGCVPPSGGGFIGWIFVNDSTGKPLGHYALWINPGCESGSWTVSGTANPPYIPGRQYCPCGGQP